MEERRKEKMKTSSEMINKQKPKVEEIAGAEFMEDMIESDDNSEELEGGIFWKEFQRKMIRFKNFTDIAKLVDSTKIPDISLQRKLQCSHMIERIGFYNSCFLKMWMKI